MCLYIFLWSCDIPCDQKLKMKEIGELVANILCLDKWIGKNKLVFLNMQHQSLYMYIHCMCVLRGFFACKHSKFPEDKVKSASFLLFIGLCNRWAFSYITHLFYNKISRLASHQDCILNPVDFVYLSWGRL